MKLRPECANCEHYQEYAQAWGYSMYRCMLIFEDCPYEKEDKTMKLGKTKSIINEGNGIFGILEIKNEQGIKLSLDYEELLDLKEKLPEIIEAAEKELPEYQINITKAAVTYTGLGYNAYIHINTQHCNVENNITGLKLEPEIVTDIIENKCRQVIIRRISYNEVKFIRPVYPEG
jgi:hypothetical protein